MLCMTFHSHDYQMFRKAWGTYELIKDKHGFVLGGMEGTVFQDYELQMESGASLFLYTDGLAEAVDQDEQVFGTDRILEKLNTDPERSPEKILHDMRAAVYDYTGTEELFDDLTMMCMTYHGQGKTH